MSHELSKRHQEQIAEKAAIIANTAFGLGRTAERNRIIAILEQHTVKPSIIKEIIGEETNAGSN
jgi:hypothetical protein